MNGFAAGGQELTPEKQIAILHAVVSHFPDAVVFVDADFVIRAANAKFADQMQIPPDEVVGRHVDEVIPDWTTRHHPIYLRVRQTGKPVRIDGDPFVFPNDPARGLTYWDLTIGPVYGSDGGFLGWLQMQREVTRHRKVETSLRLLAEVSAELATSLDYGGTLQRVARAAIPSYADHCVVDILPTNGLPKGIVVASVDHEHEAQILELRRRYPPNLQAVHSPVARAVRTGRPQLINEYPEQVINELVADPSERQQIAHLVARSLITAPLIARGRILGTITFGSRTPWRFDHADIALTEDLAQRCALALDNARLFQQAQQAEAEAAQRANRIAEYHHLIAHDLRQPLTIVRGHAQILRAAIRQGKLRGANASVEAIDISTRRLDTMLRDLVESARLEAGVPTLECEPVGLVTFIFDLLQRLSGTLETHRVFVEGAQPLVVLADPNRLERILSNLLSNALKYSDPHTEISVRIDRQGTEGIIAVTDRGPGIAPDDLTHLFERGFRSAHSADRTEGLGLGLYITRLLVEAHHGRIWVETELGKGSTFYVALPICD